MFLIIRLQLFLKLSLYNLTTNKNNFYNFTKIFEIAFPTPYLP